ncbi:hypothetical protein OsccyDRAFT_1084 [Leptolyngbyaceae cyanobacterium JSC-12]|nr:hypothetical protein OsccyDRAFT_1084 [Leptolyngbyaceae cyanobacterium JSC-12]
MLPLILSEQQIFIFKFWFNNQLCSGMTYQNELFCQIGAFDADQRPQVYQTACKLAQHDVNLIVTCSKTTCRLWGSLRDEAVKRLLLTPSELWISTLTHKHADVDR